MFSQYKKTKAHVSLSFGWLRFQYNCHQAIKPGMNSGAYTINRKTATRPIRYGTTALEIFSIGCPVILVATYRLIATGGVIIPIAIPTTKRIPKWSVEIPRPRMRGRKTGVRRMIAEEVSMNTPATRIIRLMRKRIIYLLVETASTAVDIA